MRDVKHETMYVEGDKSGATELGDTTTTTPSDNENDTTNAAVFTEDPVATKRLLRKCDLHIVPILFLLFLLTFLDRSNIGEYPGQEMHQSTLDMMTTWG